MKQQVLLIDRVPHNRMNGVARYMIKLVRNFRPKPHGLDIRILCHGRSMRPSDWLKTYCPPQPIRPLLSRIDKRLLQPIAQRQSNAALVHFPFHNLPPKWNSGTQPCIITIHGAAAVAETKWGVNAGRADRIRQHLQSAENRLVQVITVSQWAKGEIAAQFNLDPALITSIYHGVDPTIFHPPSNPQQLSDHLRESFGIDAPYLLHVGPCSPRKNVNTLLDAFALLKQHNQLSHQLVLVGRNDADRQRLLTHSEKLGVRDDIIVTGTVGDTQLAQLYGGADCFVFPSLYEGFGMPIIEAMACGTPVVTSACTAMPEIAGGAAQLVQAPQNVNELANAIELVLQDSELSERMVLQGLERAKRFSWKNSAEKHLQVYRRALDNR